MQIQQKNIREGDVCFKGGTILKQSGHCFIDFGCTQFGHSNQRFV